MKIKTMARRYVKNRGIARSLYIYAENVPKLNYLLRKRKVRQNELLNSLISKAHEQEKSKSERKRNRTGK